MNILDSVTRDLDWREAEIAAMRMLLSSPAITPVQRRGLLRAAWALLYAHYEGFCKNTLTAFYDVVANCGVACRDLPQSTKLFALEKHFTEIRKMTNDDLLLEIADFEIGRLAMSPRFPDVDTKSNLWPTVLIDLMETADLDVARVKEHQAKLKTLVNRRNKIAHGEHNIIEEIDYYRTYEKSVYDVMYDIALQVDSRLARPPFSAYR